MSTSPDPTELPAVHEAWLPRQHPLHRPRHGGRQLTALVCAALFFAAPLVTWTFGARPEPVENREMAEFPSVTDGWGMFTGLGPWATDHLPFRAAAVRSADGISRGVFGEPGSWEGGSSSSPVGGGDDKSDSKELDESVFPSVIDGKNGWLYLGHDISYPCVPKMPLDKVINGLQRWRDVVESSGREFRLVIAPDKTTMHPGNLPDEYAGEQCSTQARKEFWKRVPQETGAIDMRQPLRDVAERNGRPVYHDIDTHWTHEGGLAMAYQLAEHIDPGITNTWEVSEGRSYPHSADIPDLRGQDREVMIESFRLAPDGETDTTRSKPSDFDPPLRSEAAAKPGMVSRPTRMIADSFTQFASPYLMASFADLGIAHPKLLAREPERVGSLLAESEIVVFELSERFVLGGRYSMLDPAVAEQVGGILANRPVP